MWYWLHYNATYLIINRGCIWVVPVSGKERISIELGSFLYELLSFNFDNRFYQNLLLTGSKDLKYKKWLQNVGGKVLICSRRIHFYHRPILVFIRKCIFTRLLFHYIKVNFFDDDYLPLNKHYKTRLSRPKNKIYNYWKV